MDWSLTRIGKNVDFDADGLQIGELRVPPTTQNAPPGFVPVPVAVVRNGDGPTVLLTAGNHGDEYEGPIALLKLIGSIDPAEVRGRIIAIPYLNAPAVGAAQRCSPIDGANLNRVFPGDRDGGPTQMIAHLVEEVLLPGCALALDYHSGGRVAYYGSCTLVYRPEDDALYRANLEYAEAFGAPACYLLSTMSDDRTFPVAAARKGVPSVSTELGGLSILTGSELRLAEAGLRRVLKHAGVLPNIEVVPPPPTRFVRVTSYDNNVYAPIRGLFEARFEIGDEVRAGDVAGYIYSLDEPFSAPRQLSFGTSGIVLVKQGPVLVEKGTRLSVVATPGEP
jgi:predicted deacylase